MSGNISLIVLIEVQTGKRKEQINSYRKLAPLVLAEPGCLAYELKAVDNNENQFVLAELWESQDALDAHDITPHMIEADSLTPSFRAKPATVLKLVTV